MTQLWDALDKSVEHRREGKGSDQFHLGRVCLSHVRILDLKRKIIVMTCLIHTWWTMSFSQPGNGLVESMRVLSAGLIWTVDAADNGQRGKPTSPP